MTPITSLPLRFIASHGMYSVAMGAHMVLIAWLAASYLRLIPVQLAWVQAASLLPSIAVLLLSGVLADRLSIKRLLVCAYVGLTASYSFLAVLLYSNTLSFVGLLVYGVSVGVFNSMTQPAREKWLAESTGASTQKRFSMASIAQFASQAGGMLLAGAADKVGVVTIVSAQLLLVLLAMVGVLTAMQPKSDSPTDRPIVVARLKDDFVLGLRHMLANSVLLQIVLLAGFNGFFHMGLFLVALPMLASDVYRMDSFQFAALQFTFLAGMIAAYVQIYLKSNIVYPGQGVLFCLLYSGGIAFALAQKPTLIGFYMVLLFWGWAAGQSACRSRLVLHAITRSSIKGRIASLYLFAFFGMAPLGALAAGYGAQIFSLAWVLTIVTACSVLIFVSFMFSRSLWSVTQGAKERTQDLGEF